MERKFFVNVAMVACCLIVVSCQKSGESEEDKPVLSVLSFEDEHTLFEEYSFVDDLNHAYSIARWSDLIPAKQYGDAMIYGSAMDDYEGWSDYYWYDKGNTFLYAGLVGEQPIFWNGGHVVSDFYGAKIEGATYLNQLEVSVGGAGAAGHNGSKNFCVHNDSAEFKFGDGVERLIDHMYVTCTTYLLASLIYGDAFAAPAGDDSWLKIVATGYNSAGEECGTAECFLCRGKGDIMTTWERFDLSPLGKVARVRFHLEGSDDLCGEWGLNTPTYFAYDDVAVWIEE